MVLATRVLLLATSAFAVFLLAGASPTFVDDTFITLNYSRNLIEFGGFYWHPSLPPVDGFTSLAHMLVIATGHYLGFNLIAWNSVLNLMFAISVLVMLFWATRSLSVMAAFAGFAVLSANATFLYWLSAGLEALLYVAVFFAVYLTFERAMHTGRFSAALTLALVALAFTRPEGLFIALALIATFWLSRFRFKVSNPAASVISTAFVLLCILGQVLWRITLFGNPLPNTYYAKASESRLLEVQAGIGYVQDWILTGSGFLLAFTILALACGSRTYLRSLFILGQIGVVIMAGGDPHPAFRFLLPILPLIALDCAWIFDRYRGTVPGISLLLLALVFTRQSDVSGGMPTSPNPLAGFQNISRGDWPVSDVESDPWALSAAKAAEEMAAILPSDVQIAATDVGALAYFSGLPILDTHGLNHPIISHLPKRPGHQNNWGNYRLDYLIDQAVPLVLLHFPGHRAWSFDSVIESPEDCDFHAARVSRMASSFLDELAENYLCMSIPSRTEEGSWLNMFIHRDQRELLQSLPEGVQTSDCLERFRKVCSPLG